MIGLVDQAWNSPLKCTMQSGMDENKDKDNIFSAINMTYSETTSRHATSVQAEFAKLFAMIVCTALLSVPLHLL